MIEALLQQASRFEFFQAVRLLQQAGEGFPVGYDQLPSQEALRFRAALSPGFPCSSVVQLRRTPQTGSKKPLLEMEVAFMGLVGAAGVLPEHYTTLVNERIRNGDFALRDFLDMFNHRLISLFYRAWEKSHLPAAYQQAQRKKGHDCFSDCLYSLIGLGTGHLHGRMSFREEGLLCYAGLLADAHRPAIGLQQMLADYFGVPVALEHFRGQWLSLAIQEQTVMPGDNGTAGRYHQLGVDSLVGDSVWDVENMFRVKLGPLTFAQFCHWIPTADAVDENLGSLRPLCQLVRTYVGLQLEFDVQALLQTSEIPFCYLGDPGVDELPGRVEGYKPLLGWTTWLMTEPLSSDKPAEDAVFALDDV